MFLFDNGEPEEFLLFVINFNTTLTASWALEADAKFQYLCTFVSGEALHQFDSLADDVENIETLNMDYIIRGLAQYSLNVNFLSKYKHKMRHGMKNHAV